MQRNFQSPKDGDSTDGRKEILTGRQRNTSVCNAGESREADLNKKEIKKRS